MRTVSFLSQSVELEKSDEGSYAARYEAGKKFLVSKLIDNESEVC